MIELRITEMGAQGDGVAALPQGGHAFLPYTLPGEVVEAHLGATRQGGVAAAALSILAASPDRVAAPCLHFGRCGSCALQHWADAPYAAWKRGRLVAALETAGFDAPLVHELARTPPGTSCRAARCRSARPPPRAVSSSSAREMAVLRCVAASSKSPVRMAVSARCS